MGGVVFTLPPVPWIFRTLGCDFNTDLELPSDCSADVPSTARLRISVIFPKISVKISFAYTTSASGAKS